jgi:hypothetical protein
MASLEQENASRSQLLEAVREIAKMKTTDLARTDLGADLSFESATVYFARTLRLFRALSEFEIDDLSFTKTEELKGRAIQVRDLYRNIAQFSIKQYQNNPIGQRDSFINQVRDQYDDLFNVISPAVAFLTRRGTDFVGLEERAKETVGKLEQTLESQRQASESLLKEAKGTIDTVRRMAEEAGVSQHAMHFKNEAERNEKDGKPWLVGTIVLASVTAALAFGLTIWYFFYPPTLTPSQSVQLAIPKIFLFSLLLSAVIWTGRTYRAYRHNAIVNKHRQNALASFESFAKAASGDEETKNAVLLQATQCIFAPQATGYIQAEAESSMPQVLEVVRGLGKTS